MTQVFGKFILPPGSESNARVRQWKLTHVPEASFSSLRWQGAEQAPEWSL